MSVTKTSYKILTKNFTKNFIKIVNKVFTKIVIKTSYEDFYQISYQDCYQHLSPRLLKGPSKISKFLSLAFFCCRSWRCWLCRWVASKTRIRSFSPWEWVCWTSTSGPVSCSSSWPTCKWVCPTTCRLATRNSSHWAKRDDQSQARVSPCRAGSSSPFSSSSSTVYSGAMCIPFRKIDRTHHKYKNIFCQIITTSDHLDKCHPFWQTFFLKNFPQNTKRRIVPKFNSIYTWMLKSLASENGKN